MSRKNAKPGDHQPSRALAGEPRSEENRQRAFPGVEQQRENSRNRSGGAQDIRRADIAAARLANVRRAEIALPRSSPKGIEPSKYAAAGIEMRISFGSAIDARAPA